MDTLTTLLNNYSSPFLSWWLPMQVQTGIFVVIILGIDALLPNASPRFRYALWLTALVKAMLPPVISLPVNDTIVSQVYTYTTVEISPVMQQSIAGYVSVEALLVLVVLGSSLTLAAVALWHALSLHWLLTGATALPASEYPGLPPIYVSENIPSPLATGIFRPRIYITPEMASSPKDVLKAVLHHEAMHLHRHDGFVVLLQSCVQIVYAVNPLIWLLNLRLFRYREQICDDEALRRSGVPPQRYGRLLLSFVDERPNRLFQTGTCFYETRRGFADRIAQLFNNPENPAMKWKQYLLVVTLSLVSILLSWNCGDSPKEAEVGKIRASLYDTTWMTLPYGGPDIVGGVSALKKRLVYPEAARKKKLEGVVLVEVTIKKDGSIDKLTLKRSVHPLLDAAALEAVAGLTFKRGYHKDRGVISTMTIPIKFKLN